MTEFALITSTYLDKREKEITSVSIIQFGETDLFLRENLQNSALRDLLKAS